ncbi:NUDIX hydrolase [Janibacter anophelis]|uniref:NUDIX hydrolase n=1 Tax=Janibacter anophelis TaxID=319054 RepID=UPI001964C0BA|nr:NUDIX hydrolase [Janibacter anophelis]
MSSVVPRPAVSVIPLRDGPDGLEAFVQHRATTMDFAAGVVVFPGGRCDPADEAKGAQLPLPESLVVEHVRRWSDLGRQVPDAAAAARTRIATGLRELAEETGHVAAPADLHPWDCWVTPEGVPKRFDVAFFVLPVERTGPQPRHLTSEAVDSRWEGVGSLLDDALAGRLRLMTPTRVLLEELRALGTLETVLALQPVITGVRDDRAGARPRRRQVTRPV